MGDFNRAPDDESFEGLDVPLNPLFTGDIRTTISEASLYDNIWISGIFTGEYAGRFGVDRFDQVAFGNDDQAASSAVSDHRAVWAIFRTDGEDDD